MISQDSVRLTSNDQQSFFRASIVKEHLFSNVYKEVFVDSNKKVFKNLKEHVKKYKSKLTKNRNQFYCLPKVHKSTLTKNEIITENGLNFSPTNYQNILVKVNVEAVARRCSSK